MYNTTAFIIYGVVGVGLLGVEFFQCTIIVLQTALVLHTSFVLAFDLYHLPPSLSDIHLLENDKYSD